MRKVDIVLIGGLLVIAAGLAWQQVMLRRLAVHVEEGMAEGSRSAAAGGSTPASAQGSVGTAASSGVTESSSTAQAQLELVMGLSRHSDRQVRQGAVLILGRLGAFQLVGKDRRRVRDRLISALRLETDSSMLRALLKALEDLDPDGYGEILLKVTATGSSAARRNAASILSSKAKPGMGPSIVQLLTSLSGTDGESRLVRQYLIRALQRAPYPGAVTPLLSMLRRGSNRSTQSRILTTLAACATFRDGPQLLSALQEFAPASSSQSNYTATYLIAALARLGDIRATTALFPYLNATSSSIRRATIRALGQLLDPLAASALIKAHAEARAGSSERRSLERLFSSGYPGVRYQARVLERGLRKKKFVCPCGTSEIYITCYGDIIPCPFIQIAFGNVREDPFEEIYSRMANWKKTEDKPMCSSAEDPHFRSRYVDPLSACDIKPVRYEEHPEFEGES